VADRHLREGFRAAFAGGPGELLSLIGSDNVARFRTLCDQALFRTELVVEHAERSAFTDPQPGDVVAISYGRHPTYRIVRARFRDDAGVERVTYGSNPWDDRREPKGRTCKLSAWASWCNHRRCVVVRLAFQPMPCRAVVQACEKYPLISCRNKKRLRDVVIQAFEASSIGEGSGEYSNPYEHAVVSAFTHHSEETYCVACADNAAGERAVPDPDPAMLSKVLERSLERVEKTWGGEYYGSLLREEDAKHSPARARAILTAAIEEAPKPWGNA
jgi:hypothetical protein